MKAVAGTVLVTGAGGYVGSAVVRQLLSEGVPVRATARRATDRLARELGTPVEALDITGTIGELSGVDTIVHCATANDIVSRDVGAGIRLSVLGTQALIEQAAEQGVRRFVFLSTIQVYGTELSGFIDESSRVRCETPYALNHYLGEQVCRFYSETRGIDVVLLRPSNVYGVPATTTVDRWTLVPMCFVREAWQTGAITLKSSGRQFRNFVSTGEVAVAVSALLAHFPPGCSVVNVTSDWSASIREIAETVRAEWAATSTIPLALHTLSSSPAAGTPFEIASRLSHLRPTIEQSRQQMRLAIRELLQITLPN